MKLRTGTLIKSRNMKDLYLGVAETEIGNALLLYDSVKRVLVAIENNSESFKFRYNKRVLFEESSSCYLLINKEGKINVVEAKAYVSFIKSIAKEKRLEWYETNSIVCLYEGKKEDAWAYFRKKYVI